MATSRSLRSSTLALGALSAATAVALTRVLAGTAWLAAAVACVAAAHTIGAVAAARRWSGWLTSAAQATAAMVVTLWIVVPSGVVAGVPTGRGLGDWAALAGRSIDVLRTAVVPVSPRGAALLLALAALWAAAAAAQWSAARLDGVLGAMAPQLALFIAIGALGKGSQWLTTALWAGAAAAFLLCAHLERLTAARTWFHARQSRPPRVVAGGAVAIVAAVAGGALVGPALPGSRADALLDYRGLGSGRGGDGPSTITAISPLVGIGNDLNRTPALVLFQVTASAPARWRLVALDDFDGVTWTLNQNTSTNLTPAPEPTDAVRVDQEYKLTNLAGKFLPAAYRAVAASTIPGLRTVPDSATLVVGAERPGRRYTVRSEVPAPTRGQLRAARPVVNPTAPEVARALRLPNDFSARLRIEAARIVGEAGAATPYDKALALQEYLRSRRFTYDQKIAAYSRRDALERFLFETRRGFCQQFAGAFGALARSLGLPTRLAVGFLPGTRRGNTFTVSTKDAHAWPEVYFDGLGWIAFEPTPSRFDSTSPGNPNGTGTADGAATTTTTPATASTSGALGSLPTLPRDGGRAGPGPGLTVDAPGGARRPGPEVLRVVGGLALAGLLAAGTAPAVRRLRRWRRARVQGPRRRILGAWAEALDALAMHGITRAPSRTPVEFAMRDAPALGAGAAGPALVALARLSTSALYAPSAPSDDDADSAWAHARAVLAALRAGPRRRRRAPWRGARRAPTR